MNHLQPIVSCVVRHHEPAYRHELQRCLFSLAGQTCPNIEVILTLQRFSPTEVLEVKAVIEPLLSLRPDFSVRIINLQDGKTFDARSILLNLGLQHAHGRYVGFLDYDDTLYPEAYRVLTGHMHENACGIAFASVRIVRATPHRDYTYLTGAQEGVFKGKTLLDLFKGNFCPLHSYLIDRQVVVRNRLSFDNHLKWEEDYDFLLQVTAKTASSFELVGTSIGDYYIKNNNSNTVGLDGVDQKLTTEQQVSYAQVSARIELRRHATLIAMGVQSALGIRPFVPRLTIRSYMDSVLGDSCTPDGHATP